MERTLTMRRAVLALLLATATVATMACSLPSAPPLRFCGVDTLRVPVTIGDTTYEETIIRPLPCED